jgi:hypothetical protein
MLPFFLVHLCLSTEDYPNISIFLYIYSFIVDIQCISMHYTHIHE